MTDTAVLILVAALVAQTVAVSYALVSSAATASKERLALVEEMRGVIRQSNRAILSKNGIDYERAEALGAVIEERHRTPQSPAPAGPPEEGFG